MAFWMVVLSLYLTACTEAAIDTSVCNTGDYPAYTTPPLPLLPDQVTWRVEGNMVNKNLTYDFHQFIDFTNNKMALHTTREGKVYWTIMKYDTNEVISLDFPVDPTAPGVSTTCSIKPLNTSFIAKTLGDNFINGKVHVTKPIDGLRLSTSNAIRYAKKQTLQNGVKCDVWEGCLYWDATGTTIKATWYFNDLGTWYTAMGRRAAPVLMSVVGTTRDRTTQMLRNFNHQYVFADFRPYLSQGAVDSFQIPRGVVCKNDVTHRDLPKIPSHFSVKAEILDGVTKYVNWIKEFYDTDLKLSRYDYREEDSTYKDQIIRVHDFNSGVAYTMNPRKQSCMTTSIDAGFDDKTFKGIDVRMRTPLEFFYLDKLYTYVGQRTERGIVCDVWVMTRVDYPPPGPSFETTWEYYFTANTQESVGSNDEFNIPVKIQISSANPPVMKAYNFYEFNTARSLFNDFDVSMCFNASSRADFLMVFPGSLRNYVFKNIAIFKRLVILSVTSAAVVSPIRVTNVQVDFNSTGLLLTFSLLDLTGVKGDVVSPSHEPNLDGAITNLKQSIDTKQFAVLVNDASFGDDLRSLKPKSYSYSRGSGGSPRSARRRRDTMKSHVTRIDFNTRSASGLTAGALAGLAVGLGVGGFLLGFIILFVILKARQPGGASSFSNPMGNLN